MKLRWKIALIIGLGVLYFWVSNAFGSQAQQDKNRIDLKMWYNTYNEEYFDNELPDIPVHWGDLTSQGWLGITFFREGENGEFIPREIIIDRRGHPYPRQALSSLQHEICHVYVHAPDGLDGHGPEWDACMLRLAVKGGMKGVW